MEDINTILIDAYPLFAGLVSLASLIAGFLAARKLFNRGMGLNRINEHNASSGGHFVLRTTRNKDNF